MAAYQQGPFEDLTIQDAIVIIAVYAAQIDPEHCEADVRRIESLAERHAEFVEKKQSWIPCKTNCRLKAYLHGKRLKSMPDENFY